MPRRKVAMISLEQARWRLGALWMAGAGVIAVLLIFQSLAGAYGDRVQGVWGWALPNILPMLSLMMGVFAGAALAEHVESDDLKVRRAFYRLSMALSAFHLLAVAATLLAQPMAASRSGSEAAYDVMTLFDVSNLWLGPLQGTVAALLGTLFFTKKASERPAGE